MPNAKTRRQAPNATYIPLEYRLRLLPNAKKSTQKKRNVHGQRKKLASPNARDTNMLVFLALGNAKVLSFALGDAKVPNARYFAFWWNIGLNIQQPLVANLCRKCYVKLLNAAASSLLSVVMNVDVFS